jgi:hypothetical protein
MAMKLLDIAVEKYGNDSGLQQALAKIGVEVTSTGIWTARTKGKGALRPDILAGIVHLAFNGDWSKAGKIIDSEFLPKK